MSNASRAPNMVVIDLQLWAISIAFAIVSSPLLATLFWEPTMVILHEHAGIKENVMLDFIVFYVTMATVIRVGLMPWCPLRGNNISKS